MFKLSEKVKYMAFGALLTVIGFMLGTLNTSTDAQSSAQQIDELTVKRLKVSESIAVVDQTSNPQVLINYDENGGSITVYAKDYLITSLAAAELKIGEHGGQFAALTTNGKVGSAVTTDEDGGAIAAFANEGNGGIVLMNTMGNGIISTTNKFGHSSYFPGE